MNDPSSPAGEPAHSSSAPWTIDLPAAHLPGARRWLLLGLAALAGAGLFALLLVLARTPGAQDWLPGIVGSLDYKIITAERADDLFQWLKDNKYSYSGDEATLNHYVQKKWIFTVMKIDTMQMKRNKDGTFDIEGYRHACRVWTKPWRSWRIFGKTPKMHGTD